MRLLLFIIVAFYFLHQVLSCEQCIHYKYHTYGNTAQIPICNIDQLKNNPYGKRLNCPHFE